MNGTGCPWLQSVVIAAGQRVPSSRALRSSIAWSGMAMVNGVNCICGLLRGINAAIERSCRSPPDRVRQQSGVLVRITFALLPLPEVFPFARQHRTALAEPSIDDFGGHDPVGAKVAKILPHGAPAGDHFLVFIKRDCDGPDRALGGASAFIGVTDPHH